VEQRRYREDEIRKLNQELGKRAAELEASNKELESFAYSVSHDLRAPLRHMVGYSELLQKQASSLLDEKSQRFIRTILDSAKRMGNLIDDLLAFSRIGRAETRKTEVDLEVLVKEVVAEIGQDTKSRDIVWKIGALPACYGDRSMLRLVVVNLVSNAAKFTRMRRPAEIEIGCVDRDAPALTCSTWTSCSAYFSVCICLSSLKAPESDWPPFSASSIAMAGRSGARER
jgi:light-regulated signal transduction histidine kinase (bacteriophytochrome)